MKYSELVNSGTAFYKAFGYECIVNLNDMYIEVMFDGDDKKKQPSRKFMFSSVFYQDLLRVI